MWFAPSNDSKNWSKAARHLSRVDPTLARVIKRVGPCTLAPRRDYFVALCKSIYSQQLSVVVAATLFGRFRDQFPARRPTPKRVHDYLSSGDPDCLKRVGLSRQKGVYLLDLAEHFLSNRIPTRRLSNMTDEQVIEALIEVNGIGRWTAEMFLMFVLNRPDVLPVDDLGLREGVREIYKLPERPSPREVIELGEAWRPFRSIATWYIWRRNTQSKIVRIK
jgi:DNA-3-methyladenine glycosylase II